MTSPRNLHSSHYLSKPVLLTLEAGDAIGTYELIVPVSRQAMYQGLQGFDKIKRNTGMLFRSDKWPRADEIPMWMATVSYPLDIIWLGADQRISGIAHNVKPGDSRTYNGRGIACVELNGGVCRDAGYDVGSSWKLS